MSKFIALALCGEWGNPDCAWSPLRKCIRRKESGRCGDCKLSSRLYENYWGCPSCHKVFEHFKTKNGLITNVPMCDDCQTDGYELFGIHGNIPQRDRFHCPYCGYKADGYELDLHHEVHNKGY